MVGTSWIPRDVDAMSIGEVIDNIISLNDDLKQSWSNVTGWAPTEVASILGKSRLDWQVSLSKCLKIWLENPPKDENEGRLILAWANLGTLVEGTMKLFLCVFLSDLKTDRRVKSIVKQRLPNGLSLSPLEYIFKEILFKDLKIGQIKENEAFYGVNWQEWIEHIRKRRNCIHAFKKCDEEIGTFDEFKDDARKYLKFLWYINSHFPYP